MKSAFWKTIGSLKVVIPMVVGVLMLLSLLQPLLEGYYKKIFTGNWIIDPLIGTIAGSLSFGIPVASYVAGGELIKQGVTLLAVTAFIFSWTTVGVPMLPLEAQNLGKKFAFVRNGVNFVFSVFVAVLTVALMKLF